MRDYWIDSARAIKLAITCVMALSAGAVARPLAAQAGPEATRTAVPVLLARYEREMATPPLYQSDTGRLLLEMITGRQYRITQSRRTEILDGLLRLALSTSTFEDTRADAVTLLAVAGSSRVSNPDPDINRRLTMIYRRTNSELVKRSVLAALPSAHDLPGAVQFLRTVVEDPAPSFREEGWEAVRSLIASGYAGRAALLEIDRQGTARHPVARQLVRQYSANNFTLPRP